MFRIETLDGSILEESISYTCVMLWLWNQSHTWRIVDCRIEWTTENVPSVKITKYIVEKIR